MENEVLNKIEYLKKIDDDIYELLIDFIESINYVRLEKSFFLLAGALFEKAIYSYAYKSRHQIPKKFLSNNTSLFLLLDDPRISTDLFELGLKDNLLRYINQEFIRQKHYKELSKEIVDPNRLAQNPGYDKIEYLKIFLHFYNCCYNLLFNEANTDLSDDEIVDLYYFNYKKPTKTQRVNDVGKLNKIIFEKNILQSELCYPINGKWTGSYIGRRDIKAVSFVGKDTKITRCAFQNCTNLEIVNLDGVSIVGNGAFRSCINLKKVLFYDSVLSIGAASFFGCEKIGKIKLSNNIKEIPYDAFKKCSSLKEVILPVNLEIINSYAFYECSFKEIRIPKSIKRICGNAFNYKSKIVHNSNLLKSEYDGVSPVKVIYEGSVDDWNKVIIDEDYKKYLETNVEYLNL